MSIVKDVNVNGRTFTDSSSLMAYLTDKLKTGGKYVDGLGYVTDNYLDEFQAVKVSNQKTGGRQFRQITISPSPVGNNLSNEDYIEIGRKIAKYYYDKGYQVIIVLHLDTDTRHLHLMVNSVNYRTGKMFCQSKSDLNRLKLRCNHVLDSYGLDMIRQSDDEMLDTVVHDMNEGFDYLELFDEIMADKGRFLTDLCNDLSDSCSISKNIESRNDEYVPDLFYFCANNPARYSYLHKKYNRQEYQEVNKMDNYSNQNLPVINVEQLPIQNTTEAKLEIDLSKNVNLTVPNTWNEKQVAEFINDIEPLPQNERAFNSKIGDALVSDLYSRGYKVPVKICSSVNINLTFDEIMASDIIDIPCDVD